MEKSCRKCAPKASPRPYLILVNNPKQPLHARHFQYWITVKLGNNLKNPIWNHFYEQGQPWLL